MRALTYASLGMNILVLIPVCLGLMNRADWTLAAFGSESFHSLTLWLIWKAS